MPNSHPSCGFMTRLTWPNYVASNLMLCLGVQQLSIEKTRPMVSRIVFAQALPASLLEALGPQQCSNFSRSRARPPRASISDPHLLKISTRSEERRHVAKISGRLIYITPAIMFHDVCAGNMECHDFCPDALAFPDSRSSAQIHLVFLVEGVEDNNLFSFLLLLLFIF